MPEQPGWQLSSMQIEPLMQSVSMTQPTHWCVLVLHFVMLLQSLSSVQPTSHLFSAVQYWPCEQTSFSGVHCTHWPVAVLHTAPGHSASLMHPGWPPVPVVVLLVVAPPVLLVDVALVEVVVVVVAPPEPPAGEPPWSPAQDASTAATSAAITKGIARTKSLEEEDGFGGKWS